jgi:hypothetical protein
MKWLVVLAGCVGLVGIAGCRSETAALVDRFDHQRERAALENRAALIFTNAVLVKPRETIPATDLAFALAPLLLREVLDTAVSSNFGPARIFFQPGMVQLGGIARPQMTYLWTGEGGNQLACGVRLTLDTRGLPVIWEVLDDRPGARVVFVSRSLEERAKAAFGAPVPDRRFAVEQSRQIAPEVVVARVVEDGPVAMGPIVHQTVSQEISAVICRCMAPQARQLVATMYYELQPLSDEKKNRFQFLERNLELEGQLRLPNDF